MSSKGSKSLLLFLMIPLLGLWTSCAPDDSASYAPVIGFEGIELVKTPQGRDSLMYITFSYEDKDGDLGLSDTDTSGAFRGANNLIINFREKNNGVYTPLVNQISGLPADFDQRIPNLTPTGKNKEISGTISISFSVDPNEIYADTIEFDLHIVDRMFNESNVIEVSDVSLAQ